MEDTVMSLAAIAYHEAISLEKLEQLFRSDYHAVFACTMEGKCPRCQARFAVFFPFKDDDENPKYLADLMKLVGDTCRARKGGHTATYSLMRD
jgi:hypothetical protein